MGTISSPCVEICTLDRVAGLCTGCGRTLAEITEWPEATAERQRQIIRQARGRKSVTGDPQQT